MNQDVYRIGKCFSHRDCVIKITCKTSLLVSPFAFWWWHWALYSRGGLRQDWSAPRLMPQRYLGSALQDPASLQSPWFYILVWMLRSNSLCLQGMRLLGTKCRVDPNAQKQTFLVPFLGIYCCFGLLYIKSVPLRFLNVHSRTAGCFCWLHLLERTAGASTALKGFCFEGISGCMWKFVLLVSGYFVHFHSMPL